MAAASAAQLYTGTRNKTQGPTQLDTLLAAPLGDRVFTPARLRGGYATLDATVRA